MGDISIIARRLENGDVQYGWSGNGGYFEWVGKRLLSWYQNPEDVEYLFGLGQTRLIGKKGSEHGGCHWLETHDLTGERFWLSNTERSIFSKIAFIDYGYFYDLDHKWYYVVPGPFRIKIPLEMIAYNLNEEGYEFDFLQEIEDKALRSLFSNYNEMNSEFVEYMEETCCIKEIEENICIGGRLSVREFYRKYKQMYDYFDDWILVKANADSTEIVDIVIRKKEEKHIETCEW